MASLSPSSDSILKVERIYKSYPSTSGETPILKNIDFEVKKGEFIAIVGPSGSGKSTLLNILGTLDRPTLEIFISMV